MGSHKTTTVLALLLVAVAVWLSWPSTSAPQPPVGGGQDTIAATDGAATPETGGTSAQNPGEPDTNRTEASGTQTSPGGSSEVRWQIKGRVTDRYGHAAPSVAVRAVAETFYFGRSQLPAVTTNETGNYVIDLERWRTRRKTEWPTTYLEVRAFAPAQAGDYSCKFPADADPGQALVIEADIRLEELATITGRVLDAAGQPVPDAQVTLMTGDKPSDIMPETDTTDRDGRYRIAIGMDGPHTIHATRSDLGVARHKLDLVADKHVDVDDLVLEPSSELMGQVVYADGQPVGNAPLALSKHGPFTTDESGRFHFRNLPPGTYRITPKGLPDDGGIVTTGKGFQTVTIRSARLKLQFRSTTGQPLARQNVTAYALPESHGSDIARARTWSSLPAVVREAATTHYEYGQDLFAPHGTWFWVETPLRARRPALCIVQLRHGQNETVGELVFANPILDAKITVVARRDDGTKVTDMFVGLEPVVRAPRIPYVEVGGIEGGKRLRAPSGTYHLRVWEGWTSQYPATFPHEETVQLSPGDDIPLIATLPRGGLVELVVHSHGTAVGKKLDVVATAVVNGKSVNLAPYRSRATDADREREHRWLRAGRPAKSKTLLPVGLNTVQVRLGDDVWTKTIDVRPGTHQPLRFDIDR